MIEIGWKIVKYVREDLEALLLLRSNGAKKSTYSKYTVTAPKFDNAELLSVRI